MNMKKAVGLASLVVALSRFGCGERQIGAPAFPEQRTAIEEHLASGQEFYAVYSGEFQLVGTYESEDSLVAAYNGHDPGEITICRFSGEGSVEECWSASDDLGDGENWREMPAPGELSYAHLRTNTL